jgi:hypothetical protein
MIYCQKVFFPPMVIRKAIKATDIILDEAKNKIKTRESMKVSGYFSSSFNCGSEKNKLTN